MISAVAVSTLVGRLTLTLDYHPKRVVEAQLTLGGTASAWRCGSTQAASAGPQVGPKQVGKNSRLLSWRTNTANSQ
jgi:hypothetical protein